MTSNFVGSMLLYLAIIATSFLLRERKTYIIGVVAIATCLLYIELPDIAEYKEHYQLAGRTSFEYIISLYNFEPGYVGVVAILSQVLPFEVFYIIIVSLAIHSYLKFYEKNVNKQCYIYAVFFLSFCLYFVAFTLRTTIASMFFAYSLLNLKDNKNVFAAILIIIGATFHVAIAPMIILPILNKFSAFIARRYLLVYAIAIVASIIITRYLSMNLFVGVNEIVDLKILAYDDANVTSNSLYFVLWIIAIIGSFISFKHFEEFDRLIIITTVATIIALLPFGFIQGRFMWLTSFLFAYIFTKGTFGRFDFGKTGRLLFTVTLPLVIFLRFYLSKFSM